MKKIFTILFICLLGFNYINAQEPKAVIAEKAVSHVPTEKSVLWEITGKGLSVPSYLFGTIHMIGKDDFFLHDSTKTLFANTDQVVFEVDLEEMNNLATQFSLLMGLVMNDGITLKDLITKEEYVMVEKHFQKIGLPIPMFILERMKPMLLSTFMSGDMNPEAMSMGDMVSYEMELMTLSQKQDKKMEIKGLETLQYQMSMFDSIPYKAQAQMLVDGLKMEKDSTVNEGEDQFQIMVDLYKNEDLVGMQKMFEAEEGGIGEWEDILLKNRNKNWIPLMTEMMKDKPTFFAVGAGHLGGEVGVIALLREEGYTMTPVMRSRPEK